MATTIETGRVIINSITTPVQIIGARAGRTGLKINVQGLANSFVTIGKDNTVTPANGYPVGLGEFKFDPVTEGEVWGVGTNMTVSYLEVH